MILHIDDDILILEMMLDMVEGRPLTSVRSLEDGLKWLETNTPKLIILDGNCYVTNNGMVDSKFWIKAIQSLRHLDIPLIMYTADDNILDKTKQMGIEGYDKMDYKNMLEAIIRICDDKN